MANHFFFGNTLAAFKRTSTLVKGGGGVMRRRIKLWLIVALVLNEIRGAVVVALILRAWGYL